MDRLKTYLYLGLLFLSFETGAVENSLRLLQAITELTSTVPMCGPLDLKGCVDELCPGRERYGAQRTLPELLVSYDERKYGTLPVVEEKFLNLLRTQRQRLEELQLSLASPNVSAQALADLTQRSDKDWDQEASDLFRNYLRVEIDDTKPLAERVTVTSDMLEEDLSPEMSSTLESWLRSYRRRNFERPEDMLGRRVLTRAETLATFKSELTKYRSKLSPGLVERMDMLLQEESYHDDDEINYQAGILRTSIDSIEPRYACTEVSCRENLVRLKLASTRIALAKHLKQSDLENQASLCAASYVHHAVRYDEEQLFRALIPSVIQRLEERVMLGYSDHSKEAFRTLLAELNFVFQPRPVPSLGAELERAIAKPLSAGAPMQNIQRYSTQSLFYPQQEISLCLGPLDWMKPTDSFGIGSTDFNGITTKYPLEVSDLSCGHPGVGEQIFAHELGHVLSYAIKENKLSATSREAYLRQRACVAGVGQGVFPNDGLYSEEDMADVVAHTVYADRPELMSCALVGSENPQLENSNGDPHSTTFVRILREAAHKGVLVGPACRQIVAQQAGQMRLSPCLLSP